MELLVNDLPNTVILSRFVGDLELFAKIFAPHLNIPKLRRDFPITPKLLSNEQAFNASDNTNIVIGWHQLSGILDKLLEVCKADGGFLRFFNLELVDKPYNFQELSIICPEYRVRFVVDLDYSGVLLKFLSLCHTLTPMQHQLVDDILTFSINHAVSHRNLWQYIPVLLDSPYYYSFRKLEPLPLGTLNMQTIKVLYKIARRFDSEVLYQYTIGITACSITLEQLVQFYQDPERIKDGTLHLFCIGHVIEALHIRVPREVIPAIYEFRSAFHGDYNFMLSLNSYREAPERRKKVPKDVKPLGKYTEPVPRKDSWGFEDSSDSSDSSDSGDSSYSEDP